MKLTKDRKIFIESSEYIYRVEHLTLEGTCSKDHGPKNVKIKNLSVAKELANFINKALLPGTGVTQKKFWNGLDKCVHELGPKNKNLLDPKTPSIATPNIHKASILNKICDKLPCINICDITCQKWKDSLLGKCKPNKE